MGLRYRVDQQVIPGLGRRADIVFRRAKVAVFVDGCFWHQCPEHGSLPKSNADWWREKLDRNVQRDRDTDDRLARAGWKVMRIWEHETRANPDGVAVWVHDAVVARHDRSENS
jgi:DNA mismatch endonuclease (patch repair protein)